MKALARMFIAAMAPLLGGITSASAVELTDEDMDIVLRAYVAGLEKMKSWQVPEAEKLK